MAKSTKNGETKTSGQPSRRKRRRTTRGPAAPSGRAAGPTVSAGSPAIQLTRLRPSGPRTDRIRRVLQRLLRRLLSERELLQLVRHQAVHLLVVAGVDVRHWNLLRQLLEQKPVALTAVVRVGLMHVRASPRRLERREEVALAVDARLNVGAAEVVLDVGPRRGEVLTRREDRK